MCGHLISRTTSPTHTHRYYQRVIIYFFTGIVGELILNISVEPMYYIQNMHSLRGLSRNGVGTTSIRSVETSTNEHPGRLLVVAHLLLDYSSYAHLFDSEKTDDRIEEEEGGRSLKKRTWRYWKSEEDDDIYYICNTAAGGILSRSSRRWCSRFHTVRKTRPRYDFTFYFYNKCSRA